MTVHRNDPCPCGSGAKYKRCCLDKERELERLLLALERLVASVGDEWSLREPDWFGERVAEFYAGGLDAFGLLGPTRDELLAAELWFLLDCPLPSGETPVALRRRQDPARDTEMLARSELRAWRVLSPGPGNGFTGLCALGGGRAQIDAVSRVSGELRRGSVVVGRSVPLGPERWALIGTARVVEPGVSGEFAALLASLDAPRGQEWRVHGGVVAAAAWAWPEEREVTVDGQVVESSCARYLVGEPDEVRSRLESDDELIWRGESDDDGSLMWQWRWDPPAWRAPAGDRGVRYELCKEDAAEQPYLAEVDFDPYRDELWLFTPTPERLALARRLMRDRLGPRLGAVISFDIEPPECMPRWKRLRFDTAVGRRLAAARARQAA